MAASNYSPGGGRIRVVSGYNTIKKMPLSTSSRQFPSGSPLWTNGDSGVEPALKLTGDTVSVVHANAGFITAGFVGLAGEDRVLQQLSTPGKAGVAGPSTLYAGSEDASKPFISVYDEGIAVGPVSALAAAHEIGSPVQMAGFINETASGFYDPAGTLITDTKYYIYNNLLQVTDTATSVDSIGKLVERAPVGATEVKFHFSAPKTHAYQT